jgi:4-amino-4-deoxy-L-arabinose transferase-like glycosyltransferase
MPVVFPTPVRQRTWLVLILVGYTSLAVIYSLVTPLFEASDELWHYPMVKYLADHRLALPLQDPAQVGPWRQEGSQPPLYYMIGAVATFWIDTSDMNQMRRVNPHPDIGVVVPDGNANMVVHDVGRERFPWSGTALAMHMVRFLSILMGLGTVILAYLLGRELFPASPPVALAAAAFTAFNPMFLFVSAVINNDNLSTLIASALLLMIVRLLRRRDALPGYRLYVALGVVAGAGMLAKFQIGFMLPLIALALLIVSIRARDWRPVVLGGLISGGLTIVIAGWWYWRNYHLYGDATGINVFLDIVGRRAVPADGYQLWSERETFMMSFWGLFGGVNVPMSRTVYTLFNVLAALGVLGLLYGLARAASRQVRLSPSPRFRSLASRVGSSRSAVPPLPEGEGPGVRAFPFALREKGQGDEGLLLARVIAAVWPAIVLFSLLSWTRQTLASQGRLWFSALAPLNIGLAAGLAIWSLESRAVRAAILGAASLFFVGVAAAAPFTTIRPAYTLDRHASWSSSTLQAGPLRAACFAEPEADQEALCMAYQSLAGPILPGGYLRLSAAVTVKHAMTRDWSIFVHLVNKDGVIEAQRDVYPGGGLIATTGASPGDAWNNLIAVSLPRGIYTPQTLSVYLGFYDLDTNDRMIATGPDADPATNRVFLGQVRLEPPPGSVPNPVNVDFGGKLELLGYEVSARSLAPGAETTVTLYWRGLARLDTDYVISVQVIDPDPARLAKAAQDDHPAAPSTTTWEPGQDHTVTRTLTVFPDAAPGRYRLMVRVYPTGDVAHPLRIRGGIGDQSEDFVWLAWIQVK